MTTSLWISLDSIACYKCGVVFGIEASHNAQLKKNHKDFYCPNGHVQRWLSETEEDRLKRETQRLARQLENQEAVLDRERRDRLSAERSAAAQKGVVTKIKNRVGKGVCPCCNRSFGNLHHHMKTQHPTWINEDHAASSA